MRRQVRKQSQFSGISNTGHVWYLNGKKVVYLCFLLLSPRTKHHNACSSLLGTRERLDDSVLPVTRKERRGEGKSGIGPRMNYGHANHKLNCPYTNERCSVFNLSCCTFHAAPFSEKRWRNVFPFLVYIEQPKHMYRSPNQNYVLEMYHLCLPLLCTSLVFLCL